MAGEEQPGNDDDAELGDGQKERSKRGQGHSALIVGLTSVAVTPREGDPCGSPGATLPMPRARP
jgi:hypothetical protein